MSEEIFKPDELTHLEVDPRWSAEHLLQQQGVVFLKDIVPILQLKKTRVVKHYKDIGKRGEDPWRVMGVRKIWSHWMVRMTVFAPYYQAFLQSNIQRVKPEWNSNELMQKQGVFFLTEVCRRIPFSTYQIRYQAQQNPRSRTEYGVWKDESTSRLVVDMPVFSVWIKKLWKGSYRHW